ncbi:hypothetical protein ACNKHT_17010 [Shigella flexneri]
MHKDALNNVHITDEQVLMTPEQLKAAFPLSLQQEAQIADSRKTISYLSPGAILVCGHPYLNRHPKSFDVHRVKPLPQR